MFKLVIQDDEGKTTVVPLIRDEITIGRKEGNTIRLTERNVSRRHARILRNNGEVQIEDLGSYNGIRVNNARIAERVSLRISDQVQIGDYKLYLKAEGVEQVDDARTMPIERIDQGLPTEVMPAVVQNAAAAAAPAAPAGTPVPPTPIPGTPVPNRSPVAVADTDPAGRPVASAATLKELNPQTGYGRLVVLSSNFAGKEYDLTRPQMIVSRTPENDIVIDHRSISRNHAKVTRDPDSGRYTISDLQSSNGVRVNGQDYGKVELRRGDTVDLGHVRLRFVEPGEDFVFSRDAVIADVPDTGSKKGWLAILFGLIVLGGGVAAFFVLKGKDHGQSAKGNDVIATNNGNNGKGSNETPDNGTGPGSEVAVNPVTTNGSDQGSGSDQAMTMVKPGDVEGQTKVDCQQAMAYGKWSDLSTCSEKLAKYDKALATQYGKTAHDELENQGRFDKLNKENDYAKAKKLFDGIPEGSYYHKDAKARFDQIEQTVVDLYASKASAMKSKGQCNELAKLVNEARDKGGPAAAKAVSDEKAGCTEPDHTGTTTVAQKDCSSKLLDSSSRCSKQFCANPANKEDSHCSTGSVNVTAPAGCDADALKDKGLENVNMGQHAAALAQFESSLRCKNDPYVVALAFMAACNAQNAGKAKLYYGKLQPAQQTKYKLMCVRNHVDLGP